MPTSNILTLSEHQNKTSIVSSDESATRPSEILESQWIASGPIGSRDAVLIFRNSVLDIQRKQDERETQISLTNSAQMNSRSRLVTSPYHHLASCSNSITSSSGNRIKGDNKISSNVLPTPTNKVKTVLSSLPDIKNDGVNLTSETVRQQLNSNRNDNRKTELVAETRLMQKSYEFRRSVDSRSSLTELSTLSPKKCSAESLSSSDSSIFNEYYPHTDTRSASSNSISSRKLSSFRLDKACDESSNPLNSHLSSEINRSIEGGLKDDTIQMPAFELKICYKFMNTETKLMKKIFVAHGLTEVVGNQHFNILWTGLQMKPDILRNLSPYQRVNHFPRSYELTRKDTLYKNISKMQHLRGLKHFDIVPQSFILPLEYRDLVSAHYKNRGPWIVKPAASSRGRGIFIVNSPDLIPLDEQVLVSKYITDPLCIDGHKCDLRIYVLVTSFDPLLIYVYEEGLVRLATVKYDRTAENLWNPCMHLCNYSINKYHSDYIKSNDAGEEDVGHKWTLSALLRHLKYQGCDTRRLMSNIEDLIIKSMLACGQSIISACRMFVPNENNCFELYGFDILIDDSLKPWLLEVNLSPSLGVDTPLDAKVKASLITDLLTLIGIPAYSPSMRAHIDSKFCRSKNIVIRRTHSAASLNGSTAGGSNRRQEVHLSPDETRVVRNAKLQNERRGRFVRIFPSDDTWQRYGNFLDPITGIPLSTVPTSGARFPLMLAHNYNQLIFTHLYSNGGENCADNNFDARMRQYERALGTIPVIGLSPIKSCAPKSVEEGKRLRRKIINLIENGIELSHYQARLIFSGYLECILGRLTNEPRMCHEKLIMKFLNRISGSVLKPPPFLKNPKNQKVLSKDRTAMVAKLLADYLESYNRESETVVESSDRCASIPSSVFNDFLTHASEADIETVLTLSTNKTQSVAFFHTRYGQEVKYLAPISTQLFGFLKALPGMIPGPCMHHCTTVPVPKVVSS